LGVVKSEKCLVGNFYGSLLLIFGLMLQYSYQAYAVNESKEVVSIV